MTETRETRPPSTALVEEVLTHSLEPLTADEIAKRTEVANTTIWRGLQGLRSDNRVRPTDTSPIRWRLR
jgi:response regulator of citrate/malate metabolism